MLHETPPPEPGPDLAGGAAVGLMAGVPAAEVERHPRHPMHPMHPMHPTGMPRPAPERTVRSCSATRTAYSPRVQPRCMYSADALFACRPPCAR